MRRPPGARTRRAAPSTRRWLRDANLYVGGEFTSIDGTARNRLAAVEVVDGDALSWNPNVIGTSAVVEEIEIVPGSFENNEVTPGKLYIGGRFTQIGLLPRGGYAGFNETTEPPSNTVAPAITGTAQPGNTVNCSSGTWTGSPTSFSRQWLRGRRRPHGATAASYAVQVSDVGATLVCRVTASNVGGRHARRFGRQDRAGGARSGWRWPAVAAGAAPRRRSWRSRRSTARHGPARR